MTLFTLRHFGIKMKLGWQAQIYKGDLRTCAIFIPARKSNWGSLVFHNQNNRGSSGTYVTCIYCGLSVKINMCKTPHSLKIVDAFVFACVVSKNLKTPNLSLMADDTITRGSMRGLGSPLNICGGRMQLPLVSNLKRKHWCVVSTACHPSLALIPIWT